MFLNMGEEVNNRLVCGREWVEGKQGSVYQKGEVS